MAHSNPITIGMLAHVDAGKTTLSEAILYSAGSIRKLGRVDNQDTFLDTGDMERARGITIFSKQAAYNYNGSSYTLLDTPGHVDFSAETERTLWVLDAAVLVISGMDGVQGHTETLWSLLKRLGIPVFIFVNKMDQQGTNRARIMEQLKNRLSESCVDFNNIDYEEVAMCHEEALEQFLESAHVDDALMSRMIMERKMFPVYFGSALRMNGVEELINGIDTYVSCPVYGEEFSAKVYKITRDDRGERLTHLKVCGGSLKSKMLIGNEKVNQIRVYAGDKFTSINEAVAGTVCAVTGLSETKAGQFIGAGGEDNIPVLEPVLNYKLNLPAGTDPVALLSKLRTLEEEEPELHVEWDDNFKEIHVSVMGPVLIEVLTNIIKTRFGVDVTFGEGSIVYKETITNRVEGVGHYEPLRHYAEVHLIMEPGEPGSGLTFDTICSEDDLDRNWQRLIFTHLEEREHRGVLTGAPITDMKITLAAGRAHLKHTEGGDFRQSTYRAIRQGLMQADSVLLEPYYAFELEIPASVTGRALNDMQRLAAEADAPQQEGNRTRIKGLAPVATMRDYQREVAAYSHGEGRLACVFSGYRPCHNAEEVIEAIGYDAERDMENPAGSVFCSHGAGYYVPWDEVPEHMHIESQLARIEAAERQAEEAKMAEKELKTAGNQNPGAGEKYSNTCRKSNFVGKTAPGAGYGSWEEEKELEEIFIRTYGKIERKLSDTTRTVATPVKKKKSQEHLPEYLLVDGYNVIFAWDELKELAKDSIEAARDRLMDILCNYQGYKKCTVILVFDAYRVEGPYLEIQKYHNIHVVFTKEAETADQYIEKVVHEVAKKYRVTVVTSDGIEQVVTVGQGANLISSREFYEEVEIMKKELREEYIERHHGGKNYLFDHMDEELVKRMEKLRLSDEEIENW